MKPINIFDDLKGNTYPGRGIVIGQSEDGKSLVTAYFIMGRSVNSRNRVFVAEGENMRTQAHDPALLTDPSLVIYYPVRTFDGGLIVTNGDQTDTIYNLICSHPDRIAPGYFVRALLTRTFEPDPPLTYKCDGDPVPSFVGEPKPVSLSGDIDSFTDGLWESLNQDNKVSLFVRYIDLESGEAETRIVNKNK